MGNGAFSVAATASPNLHGEQASRVASHGLQVCVSTLAGRVYCWGGNDNGQVGNGVNAAVPGPTTIAGLSGVVKIDVGPTHVSAALSAANAMTWGENLFGELGVGTELQHFAPVAVSGLANVQRTASGRSHTCVVTSGGSVSCFGAGNWGQLGNGATSNSLTPVAASLTNATLVVSGENHSCARLGDASVVCWGLNNAGQLGTNNLLSTSTPTAVVGLSGVVDLTAGRNHTCAVRAGSGTSEAVCWGENSNGQLSQPLTTLFSSTPMLVTLSGGAEPTAIGAGDTHTCVVVSGGTLRCWGGNALGQLGNNATTDSALPVTVAGINDAAIVVGGANHTCTLSNGQAVDCWGGNGFGQLGSGVPGRAAHSSPIRVSGLSPATFLAAGGDTTCAVLQTGAVSCWGHRGFGQTGDGNVTHVPAPLEVTGF